MTTGGAPPEDGVICDRGEDMDQEAAAGPGTPSR